MQSVLWAVLVAGSVSCAEDPSDGSSYGAAARNDTGAMRSDLAPLTKRFTALRDPVSARWKSGTFGDPGAPGPSTYWIDAVVRVTPTVTDRLASGTVASEQPVVVFDLLPELPDGPWVASDRLNHRLCADGFSCTIRLDPTHATVVIRAEGEG